VLFASSSIIEARRSLYAQFESGALTREQAFARALELDPCDAVALIVLGEERLKAGDLAGTAEYCWRAAHADPCHADPWLRLSACLPDASKDLQAGILQLAARKALRDPEAIERFEESFEKRTTLPDIPDGRTFLETAAAGFGEEGPDEPEEVRVRLQPHRLIDDLLETADDGLDEELVDKILRSGERCLPLLIGVLRAMATGSLPENESAAAVCSLALLGEIRDPAVLPELIECHSVDDEDISMAASWAVGRIARARPEEFLEVTRKLAQASREVRARSALAMALGRICSQPGIHDVLLGLLDGLESFSKSERAELFMAVSLALSLHEGKEGQELAWSLLSRYTALLPKRTRAELREALRLRNEIQRNEPAPDEEGEPTVYDLCALGSGEDDYEDEDEDDAGSGDEDDQIVDEDDDFVPEPVRRGATLGRNDPCWCGSGKKYKKCHLESDGKSQAAPVVREGAPAPGNAVAEAGLRKRLIDFATGSLRKREMEEALRMFVGTEPPGLMEDDSLARESLDWIIHDYIPPRLGHSLIEEFLRRSPGGLTAHQREILEAWSRSRYSLFEVQEVRKGSGVQVKDLLAGGDFFVHDVSTSGWAVVWDCCLARVEEYQGRHEFTAIVLRLPRHVAAPVQEWAVGAQKRSGLSWDAFLRANSHKLRQSASRFIQRATNEMRVVSPEGDDLVFSRARYAVLDDEAVRGALDQSTEFHREGDDATDYGWLDEFEDATGGRRSFGHLHLAGANLTLECSTRQRLERGNALLQTLAGAHLRHLGDDFTSWRSAMRDRGSSPRPAKRTGLPPEVEREILAKMIDEHYRRWLDMPLPALHGKTPREAVATPEGRAQVIDLLKTLQNDSEHGRQEGIPSCDVSKLKAELGVDF